MGLRGLESSIQCLHSLILSLQPTKLIIHLDGPIESFVKEKLVLQLGQTVEFVEREDANSIINEMLKSYPHSRNYRNSNVLAAKIFDIVLVNPLDNLVYFDSDIYFNQKVDLSGLLANKSNIFMEDSRSSYSLRPWDVSLFRKTKIIKKVNTGMIIAQKGLLDLDFVEWLISILIKKSVSKRRLYWLEQTIWAFIAGRVGGTQLVGKPFLGFPSLESNREELSKFTAIHFVSTYRDQLKLMKPFGFASDETARWHSKPGSSLWAWNILFDDLKNRFKW